MPTNIKTFDLGVRRHMERIVPQKMLDEVNATSMSVHMQLMQETPVRTGRMKGNWQVTVGGSSAPAGAIERDDTTPKGTLNTGVLAAETAKLAHSRAPWSMIWHHNGLEYALDVNDGTENQRAQRIVERVASRHRRKA